MPNIVLDQTSVRFPVLTPGRGSNALTVGVTVNASTQVTLAISDAPPDIFVANLFHNEFVHNPEGGEDYKETQIATTKGIVAAASVSVAPPALPDESYSIQISFASPSIPVPGEFTGTLTVSWSGGSATVALIGTTAQLSAKVATAQPIALRPGSKVKVPIDLEYASDDPTTLHVNVSAATFPSSPPAGLTIGDATSTLLPRYILESPSVEKGSSGAGPPQSVLQTLRPGVATTSISARTNITPGSHEAYIEVDNSEFPQLDPASLKIKFHVPPLPVRVEPPKHKIYLLPGDSVSLQLTISAAGAETALEMGPMQASYEATSGSAPVTVAWPDWDVEAGKVQIGIGGGDVHVGFRLTAADTAKGGVVNISLPWTAYGGLLNHTATFQINIIYIRKNVWELGGDWADPILWYARGVKAMKARALKEPTGWRFYAAIHAIDENLWQQLGYLNPDDPMPSNADIKAYWSQCQHGSWYFLPWHRGYVIAFEAVVRDAVVKLGGPADWALPYWNYFKPNQNPLPPAFASPDWPDGKGDNPLFVQQRYGPNNDGNVYVAVDQINLNELGDPDFTGVANGGSPGFGGVDTGFSHFGAVHGGIETQPHDHVHVLVGGEDPQSGSSGLMTDPDTAGLDPIFWLHHSNIDRLWEVWRKNPGTDLDPTDANWVNGPQAIGERPFKLPIPGSSWTYTPGEMSNLSQLDYAYDDVSAPGGTQQLVARLNRLGMSPAAAEALMRSTAMAGPKTVELLGASAPGLRLVGTTAATSVAIDPGVQRKVAASLNSLTTAAPKPPDRIFLNLENVRGLNDATIFSVYINVPEGAEPARYPDSLAGSIALFGVRKATSAVGGHAGDGLTFVLEITHVLDALHLAGAPNVDKLDVRLVSRNPVPEAAQVSIGRISIFRQGA